MEATGRNGQIQVDGQQVVITRSGLGARLTLGKGRKTIPIASITAVQWKPAGTLVNGFIAFTVPGGIEQRSRAGRQTYDAVQDENAVVFTRSQMSAFEQVRDAVEAAIARGAGTRAVSPPASVADELTKLAGLLSQGLISRAEYDAQKARLLS